MIHFSHYLPELITGIFSASSPCRVETLLFIQTTNVPRKHIFLGTMRDRAHVRLPPSPKTKWRKFWNFLRDHNFIASSHQIPVRLKCRNLLMYGLNIFFRFAARRNHWACRMRPIYQRHCGLLIELSYSHPMFFGFYVSTAVWHLWEGNHLFLFHNPSFAYIGYMRDGPINLFHFTTICHWHMMMWFEW